jgi:hypothetical protein
MSPSSDDCGPYLSPPGDTAEIRISDNAAR